jgi:hypothetical protein
MSKKTEASDKEPEKHNPHDAAFKSAFQKKELAVSFFRTYLPADIIGRGCDSRVSVKVKTVQFFI